MYITWPTMFRNPSEMNLVLTPEQQQFVKLLSEMDFDSAVEQMDLPIETIREWFINQKFRVFVRDIEDCAIDHVYHEVILEAKRMMVEYRNLHTFMSMKERAECLKSILSVMSAAHEGRPSIYRTTWAEDAIKMAIKETQLEDEEDDEDYDDDEYEDDEEEEYEEDDDVKAQSHPAPSSHPYDIIPQLRELKTPPQPQMEDEPQNEEAESQQNNEQPAQKRPYTFSTNNNSDKDDNTYPHQILSAPMRMPLIHREYKDGPIYPSDYEW